MLRKKTLIGAAALALGPVALMAPANAYYRIGSCTLSPNATYGASISETIVSSGSSWDFTGHIGDGHGRSWTWKIVVNGTTYTTGSATGTTDVRRILPITASTVKFHFENGAGTVTCNVSQTL